MRNFSFRWGVDLFDNAHTQIPNWILKYYHLVEIGITNTEMMFIIHLASFKYESERGKACPSLTGTLRERMNYTSNAGIIKIEQSLIEKGLLLVEKRPGKTSVYDFAPLSRIILSIALKDSPEIESLAKVNDRPLTKVNDTGEQKFTQRRKEQEEKREETSAPDFLETIVTAQGTLDPSQVEPSDLDRHFGKHRDTILEIYHTEFDHHPNTGRKQALIEFSQSPQFKADLFKKFLTLYNEAGGFPYDIARIKTEYLYYAQHGKLPSPVSRFQQPPPMTAQKAPPLTEAQQQGLLGLNEEQIRSNDAENK